MSMRMVTIFSVLTVTGAGGLAWRFQAGERSAWLPGATSHGHYQIELACNRCHTPLGGVEQQACLDCHAAELERADDSHPASKFTDPRNADLLAKVDALRCVSCHVEHRPDRTLAMTVTQPADYCFHCHAEIGEERASHRGLPFTGCRDAGCHNFHDNRALTLEHLQAHLDEPERRAPSPAPATPEAHGGREPRRLAASDADASSTILGRSSAALAEWASSAHARAEVNCSDCHGAAQAWVERPTHEACRACHEGELDGFLAGRHGMRLAQALPAMRPELARQPMRESAAGHELGCNSCHGAHTYDRRLAAAQACVGCHADEHTRSYAGSPHDQLWQAELRGDAPAGSGVSCATCHMPRQAGDGGHVQHNQNDNLRPNTKQLRGVCDRCHGLGFALDALADRDLIGRSFRGRPARHVPSLDWARSKLTSASARIDRTSPGATAPSHDEI